MGYALRIRGTIGGEDREFTIGIGKAAQAKHQFRAGDVVSGESLPIMDARRESEFRGHHTELTTSG